MFIKHFKTLTHVPLAKRLQNTGSKSGLICRYFDEGTCKFTSHHTTWQFHRHVWEHCDSLHTSKTYNQKKMPKNRQLLE